MSIMPVVAVGGPVISIEFQSGTLVYLVVVRMVGREVREGTDRCTCL